MGHQATEFSLDNNKPAVRSACLQKSQGRPGQCYEAVQKLGEGAFGIAHLVRDKRSSVMRVLKTINKRQSQVPAGQLETEIRNLKACDHPHIVRLFEYYEDYENIYLIMEHAGGGELHKVLESQKAKNLTLPERWVSTVIRQCLMAIAYVHSQGIIHKDLKSENILLLSQVDVNDPQSQPHAVIIDLGIAELFSARLGRRARCTVVAGTPTHMAPEVWRGNFGPVADVWSLGVVLFELLAGELPFQCNSLNSGQEWLRMHRQGPSWSLLGHISGQGQSICKRMLNWDERMRPTAQQCLGHVWFKDPAAGGASSAAGGEGASENPNGGTSDAGGASGSGAEDTASQPPLLSARGPPSDAVVQAVGDYMGRSRFEKAILLQVASQLQISQMGRVYEMFTTADRDKNGTLSTEELVWALGGLGVDRTAAEDYVRCADLDGNGRVEYTELAAACMGLLYAELRGLLWQSFCVLDVDGNGVLGKEEVKAVVMRGELVQHGFPGNEPAANVQEIINSMDLDGNGQISFDELCRVFLPRPQIGLPGMSPQDTNANIGSQVVSPTASGGEKAKGPVIQDEEFAQLLDEIEAEHHQQHRAPSAQPELSALDHSLFGSADLAEAVASVHFATAAAAGVSTNAGAGIGVVVTEPEPPAPPPPGVDDEDDEALPPPPPPAPASSAITGVAASEPPAVGLGGAAIGAGADGLSVEEELSTLLADIAANAP